MFVQPIACDVPSRFPIDRNSIASTFAALDLSRIGRLKSKFVVCRVDVERTDVRQVAALRQIQKDELLLDAGACLPRGIETNGFVVLGADDVRERRRQSQLARQSAKEALHGAAAGQNKGQARGAPTRPKTVDRRKLADSFGERLTKSATC